MHHISSYDLTIGQNNVYIIIISLHKQFLHNVCTIQAEHPVFGNKQDQQYFVDKLKCIGVIFSNNIMKVMPNYQYIYCQSHLISAATLPCKVKCSLC